MRKGRYKLILLLLLGLFMLYILTRCGTMSDREVEIRLQEHYGKPFTVIWSQALRAKEHVEDVYCAKVYIAAPEDDLHDRFFVYSTVEGETFGVPEYTTGMLDTYKLGKLKKLFEEAAKEAGIEISFAYRRFPFKKTEEYYYSEIGICIKADPQNAEQVCEFLSNTIQKFVDETGLTPEEHSVEAVFSLDYREEEWPVDKHCSVGFCWSYNLNWDEARQEYVHGPLDYRVETIQNTLFHEIDDYKVHHLKLLEKTDPAAAESKSDPPPGITQREDGMSVIHGDKVELMQDEENQKKGVKIWSEETQQWTVYVWNEETQQYDCQTEP